MNSRRALIFGVTGQDGYYMSELCQSKGIEPIGVSRGGNGNRANISAYAEVDRLIASYKPDYVFHFAANSTTGHDAMFENHEVIATGTLNVLESVRKHHPQTKVFITGSGVQFVNRGKPISEHDPFEASSPYSVSRIQSVYAARYFRSLGIRCYVGYLFHHESPRRKPNHMSQKIVLHARRIAAGGQEALEVGDISVQKEWTFAGDVVKGIFTLVEQETIFEATIGSGATHTIEEWLEQCFGVVGRKWQDYVRIGKNFTPEYKRLVSNPATIHSLGWKPEMSIDALARLMMNIE